MCLLHFLVAIAVLFAGVSAQGSSHVISLEFSGRHICSASIISDSWAITAARCVDGSDEKLLQVRSGTSNAEAGGYLHPVIQYIVHSQFDGNGFDYDLALIRVAVPFRAPNTQAVPLSLTLAPTNTQGVVSGFRSVVLRSQVLPIVDQNICRNEYASQQIPIVSTMVCAGWRNGSVAECDLMDLGSSLIVRGELMGLSCMLFDCNMRPRFPRIFMSIVNLRGWIRAYTGV